LANEEEVRKVLHTGKDPEIPVNIVDLGPVYNCDIKEQEGGENILIQMTLTAPGGGRGPVMAEEVKQK
jgi:Predicted metal-sulfur cluster biosynthetic enzyme